MHFSIDCDILTLDNERRRCACKKHIFVFDVRAMLLQCKLKAKEYGMKVKGNTAETVQKLLEPVAESLGLSIWDVEYVREAGEMRLKITIDKESGVNIEDCVDFQHASDPVIDEADPIADSYTMEVSSPGLEREIKYDWHIDACAGKIVTVKLYTAFEGSKTYTGELLPNEEENVSLKLEGDRTVSFPKKSVAKINLFFDYTKLNKTEENGKK